MPPELHVDQELPKHQGSQDFLSTKSASRISIFKRTSRKKGLDEKLPSLHFNDMTAQGQTTASLELEGETEQISSFSFRRSDRSENARSNSDLTFNPQYEGEDPYQVES